MQEKIHQLGGSFEISSDGNGNGTIVVVTLAVDERRQLDKLKVSRANRQAIEQLARRGVLAYGEKLSTGQVLLCSCSRDKRICGLNQFSDPAYSCEMPKPLFTALPSSPLRSGLA